MIVTEVNRAFTNKNANSMYLKIGITEPVLFLACLDGASLSEILLRVNKIIPTVKFTIKIYLFHLINSF